MWLTILIFAYLFNAVSTTINKFLIEKKIPHPAVYTFFVSALSFLAVLLMPFDFHFGTFWQMTVALSSGIFFTAAVFFMFKAIDKNEISRIGPFIGGWQPLFILVLAWFLLGEKLATKSLIAFIIILAGTILISLQTATKNKDHDKKAYLLAIVSSIFFALSYTLSKSAFNDLGFISGLGWSRVGAFIGALFLLFSPENCRNILSQIKKPNKNSGGLFITSQILGAVSAILVFWAMAVSPSVAIINATRGIEYVITLIIVILLQKKYSYLLKEKLTGKIINQKIIATALIIIGLFILFY